MNILLAAAFWLIVTVDGEVRQRSGPMTGSECVLQMAFTLLQVDRIEDAGGRAVIRGRVVSRDGLEIECLPGERGT